MSQENEYCILVPFWNQKHIVPPEIMTKKLLNNGRNNGSARKAAALRQLLSEILSKLEKMKLLNKEAAVLARMVYRMKLVFRQDKGFKNVQMLLKTLKSYLTMNMSDVISSLRDCCFESSCPSLQTVEWALVCIMRISALFNRAHSLAETASVSFRERVTSGFHWKIASLCLAILSRIWVLTEYFTMKWCVWYSRLNSFLPVLVSSEIEWLPKDFQLPTNLVAWLGNPQYLVQPRRSLKVASGKVAVVESQGEENAPIEDKIVQSPDEEIKPSTSQLNEMLKHVSALEIEDDIGEAVIREDVLPMKGAKRKERFKDKIGLKNKRKKM